MPNKMVLDPFSVVPLHLKARYGDKTLFTATGFAYEIDGSTYLITNWHVVTGRNPDTGQPLDTKTGAVPDRIRVLFHIRDKLGNWKAADVMLMDENGDSLWLQHPKYGQKVDVAAVPLLFGSLDGLQVYPINSFDMQDDMLVGVGQDVFVLGYPLNIRAGGVFPIWKRASLASEPQLDLDGLPLTLVDTATYSGMSGAPVVARQWGSYVTDNGGTKIGSTTATRFVGVYSGRMVGSEGETAQLGRVWKAGAVSEILSNKVPGVVSLT